MTTQPTDIITQIHLALARGYRLAAVIGALTGGGVTYCTHAMARGDLADTPWAPGSYALFLGRLSIVLGGLLFSIVTTYSFGRSAFQRGWLAVGFLVLMDGVMVASSQSSLEWFATGLLIAIEAVTTGCTVARGRLATLEGQRTLATLVPIEPTSLVVADHTPRPWMTRGQGYRIARRSPVGQEMAS